MPKANSECCALRDGRIGIDYVEDDVDLNLQRESEMLRTAGGGISQLKQSSREMLEYLQNISSHMQSDISRKKAATTCDQNLKKLTLDAHDMQMNLRALDPEASAGWITQEDWQGASKQLMQAGREGILKSKELRSALANAQQDIETQIKAYEMDVSAALRKRLTQYKDALAEDDSILMQCQYEIETLKKELSHITAAISRQTQPMKRNTTRLEKRGTVRAAEERTTDKVNSSLVQEAAEISAAVQSLRTELELNEENFVRLREMEAMLEEDVEIKKRSIRIEKKCIYQRSYFAKFKAEEKSKTSFPNPR
jgi:chromosome segregation ATPase